MIETLSNDEIQKLFENKNDLIKSDVETQTLSADDFEYKLSLRRHEIEDEKLLDKFIKSCERLVRSSPEYKEWVAYIRDVLNIQQCEVTGEYDEQASCEIHHHPYSLYIIVKCVILSKMQNNKEFCSFDIAIEVIQLHFQMRVPFVSLLKSIHEKFTNGYLRLPMDLVHGDVKYILDTYSDYMDEEELSCIHDRFTINIDNCGWAKGYKWIVESQKS